MIDGVDVSDPEGGTIWLFANHNWIQEVQVIGLGADAEYGGFTGVASNSLFRSGSNAFSGLVRDALRERQADRQQRQRRDPRAERGPHARHDRLRHRHDVPDRRADQAGQGVVLHQLPVLPAEDRAGSGIPPPGTDGRRRPARRASKKSPRFLFKPTLQLTANDKLTGFLEYDSYTVDGRGVRARPVAPIATLHQDSPEFSWNGNYTKVLWHVDRVRREVLGLLGLLLPEPLRRRRHAGLVRRGRGLLLGQLVLLLQRRPRPASGQRQRRRSSRPATARRAQLQVRRRVRAQLRQERAAAIPADMYVFAAEGVPYGAYFCEGYLKDNINNRYGDLRAGSMADRQAADDQPGRAHRHAPRIQQAISTRPSSRPTRSRRASASRSTSPGNGKTVLRAHYGHYYDGAKSTYFDELGPNIAPILLRRYQSGHAAAALHAGRDAFAGRQPDVMDADIKHPRMNSSSPASSASCCPGWSVGRHRNLARQRPVHRRRAARTAISSRGPSPIRVPTTASERATKRARSR